MQACFLPADILLPAEGVDAGKWAVIACDQFTSQPAYWQEAARIVGDAQSTLHIVYPEAYLSEGDARIPRIREAMAAVQTAFHKQLDALNEYRFINLESEMDVLSDMLRSDGLAAEPDAKTKEEEDDPFAGLFKQGGK